MYLFAAHMILHADHPRYRLSTALRVRGGCIISVGGVTAWWGDAGTDVDVLSIDHYPTASDTLALNIMHSHADGLETDKKPWRVWACIQAQLVTLAAAAWCSI